MRNIRLILGGLVLISACTLKEAKRSSLVTSNPQKRNSTKKVKNKKSGINQTKYSSTKPIKSKSIGNFRNKSNI